MKSVPVWEQARKIQGERFAGENIRCNGEMSGRHIRKFCWLGREEEKFMEEIFKKLALSARMHDFQDPESHASWLKGQAF